MSEPQERLYGFLRDAMAVFNEIGAKMSNDEHDCAIAISELLRIYRRQEAVNAETK